MNKRVYNRINVFCLFVVFLFNTLFLTLDIKQVSAANGNNYPMIFVHGIYGWSKEEISSYNYWGGNIDIIKNLNNQGFKAMNATIGTFSSNWDRACELYYYIKGGTVDYGAVHSAKYGHERYGKTFPGIYPEWDMVSKIHLIGHNYGGQTIRLLVELLKNGSIEEQNYGRSYETKELSPLFEGGKSWVSSITTIGTPLNGSTFVNYANNNNRKDLYISLGGLPTLYNANPNYDFRLDQWGLKRQPKESISSYYSRVKNSSFWNSEDNCIGDLTTAGAESFNNSTGTFTDIYYFSYSGNNSRRHILTGYYSSLTTFTLSSRVTGSYKQNNSLPFGDKAWWPNDGAVSIISAQHPFSEPYKTYYGVAQRGIWNVNTTIESWAQEDFVGLGMRRNYTKMNNIYYSIALAVYRLPK